MYEICPQAECDTLFFRFWDEIDPTMREIYAIDDQWNDLVVVVVFDSGYPENTHNLIMATNLPGGVTPPGGAVTNIDWYQRDLGLVAIRDVDAETGDLGDMYDLIDHWVAVEDRPDTPEAAVLGRNYPNPFNPSTTIPYRLTTAARVSLTIHDAAGRLVSTLVADACRAAGPHTEIWHGLDDHGRPQPSGAYFCRLRAAGAERATRMMLVR
jgi:hypothetical protein